MADTLLMFGVQWDDVAGFKANNEDHNQVTYYHPNGTVTINTNGTHDVTAYSSALVSVSSTANLEERSVTPIESQQVITPSTGYDGFSSVTVGAISSSYVGSGITRRNTSDLTVSGSTVTIPAGYYSTQTTKSVATATQATPSISISSAGVITATSTQSAGYVAAGTTSDTEQLTTQGATTITPTTTSQTAVASGTYTTGDVTVAGDSNLVAGNIKSGISIFGVNGSYGGAGATLQAKTGITPTESSQTITADSGYDGLSSVQVDAISSTYVGSGITSRSSTDLTASGATITVPAGYYAEAASKSVASGSATTPATTIYVSNTNGITLAMSQTVPGQVVATVSKTQDITPTVSAGYVSSGTAGTITVSGTETFNMTTKGATTYYPSTSNQNILSNGYYITGTQTIKAVTTSGISAENIKSGATIKVGDSDDDDRITGVTGTFTASSTVSTGQTAATASQLLSGYSAWVDGAEVKGSIATKTSSDLTASGATVSVPAGYYAEAASKSVATTTHPNPTASFNTTTGVITASHTQTAGYVSAGTTTGTSSLTVVSGQTVSPTESEQTVTSNAYIDGTLKVGAISSTYVGSDITARDDTDLSASGATVTVPAGYYADAETYTISSGSATPAATISATGATLSTGTNTLTLTKSVSNTPSVTAGYISSGTAGNSSVSLTATVNTRSSSDLTASGATVTVPAGYYASQATKSVSTMTLPTSASGSATSGYTSKATIGRSTSDQYINIPTGYNSAGAYYKVSAVANGSVTAPSSISGTSATVSTGTNTITLTKSVSVTPNVTTAGYISSGTAGNSSVSLTASVTTKGTATITPGTSNQTIASGTYITGTQTISGDADLVASNIKTGVQIFNVTGTYTAANTVSSGQTAAAAGQILSGYSAFVGGSEVKGSLAFQTVYQRSSNPTSSLGTNGDICVVTS